MKPFLRWAGAKRQLIPQLCQHWNASFTRYIEPFAGSACLFFHIQPKVAILGDKNVYLMNTYRMVKQNPFYVIAVLKRLPKGKNNYYKIRSISFNDISEVEQAAYFIYLNKLCFNGLYRTNSKGFFNVPYGNAKGISEIDYESILNASKCLQTTQLFNGDFEDLVDIAFNGDFIYLDPPFWQEHSRVFFEYQPNSFVKADLKRLTNCLDRLHEKGVIFLVSYADCPEGMRALQPWNVRKVQVKRHIAGFAQHRHLSFELLATNMTKESL